MIAQTLRGSIFAVLVLSAMPAPAQDCSVETRVFDGRAKAAEKAGQAPIPITFSKVLFHAGKAYDCLASGNQVTIFEPAQQRFVVVDAARRTRTKIPLDEIKGVLDVAQQRAEQKLTAERNVADRRENQLTAFQIHPKFAEHFDAPHKRLALTSRLLSYSVKCAPTDHPELLKAYLDYADWAARLNFVVYPNAQFPNPRLELNDALRRHKLAPIEVTLTVHRENGECLTAQHRFNWTLDVNDRAQIREWEKNLQDPSFKTKSLVPASPESVSVRR
ncbi:MAG TPA: hypothetical protein VL475_16535 [Planctomycetaceae bacterium]|nr:hypothetical protein [Planctomycetaceae bacterium]